MLVGLGLAASSSMCASSASASPRTTRAQKSHFKTVVGDRLRRLAELEVGELPACEACAAARHALQGDADVPANVNAHNRAMALCVGELSAVQALFDELMATGVANEASYAALVRALVEARELEAAVGVLKQMLDERPFLPRVRSCAPLLQALAEAGAEEEALGLWRTLRRRGVEFTPAEHIMLLRMHARAGSTRSVAHRLDTLISEYAQLQPAMASALIEAVGELSTASAEARRTTVDARGVCSWTDRKLRMLSLDAEQRSSVRDVLLERVGDRRHQLQSFARWLDERPPFDYVLDAANIGYDRQNFEGGAFSYEQISAVAALLRARGARVLLLLPASYDQDELPNHTCSSETLNLRTDAQAALIEGWRRDGILYVCPRGIYDDLFWMYASVREEFASRVVTNDAMRDHRLDLMAPRAFGRWKSSQVLGFGFKGPTPGPPAAATAAAAADMPAAEAAPTAAGAVAEANGEPGRDEAPADAAAALADDDDAAVFIEALGGAPWVADVPSHSHEAMADPDGDVWHLPIARDEAADGGSAAAEGVLEWVCVRLRPSDEGAAH